MKEKLSNFNKRKRNKEFVLVLFLIGMVVGIVLFFISYLNYFTLLLILGLILTFVCFICLLLNFALYNKLTNSFKTEVLSSVFRELIPNIEYSPRIGLDQEVVYATNFLKRADRFYSEDLLQGVIEGVSFISSDVKLEEKREKRTEQGTKIYYETYFMGRIFRFDFNKEFIGGLQVHEKNHPILRKYKQVKLESVEFNKKFKTFTNEDLTAFYILTPDIMEAIFNLENKNTGILSLSFHGNYLYVAINNRKDTFAIKMFKKINKDVIKKFEEELLVIKDFIVTLKLNNKLFKKD